MSLNYPETLPEIQLLKKKGLQSVQVSQIQDCLIEKAKEYVGAEMIYDLVEYAKVF